MRVTREAVRPAPPGWPVWLGLTALVLVTYSPAWHGDLLWDDEGHITPVPLRSLAGLWRVWTEIGATQQFYPLTHSAFWLLQRMAGDATTVYHLTSVILHGTAAWLFARLLYALRVPGGLFAAFWFAVHPVHVESVAWISELKNTLSACWYLAAALAWVRFDDTRARQPWLVGLACFTLALLSKTVTATLPAALLVIAWWKRGRLEWQRDVVPLLPLFALAVAAGATTAWIEYHVVGARGMEFQMSALERTLVAGRVVWFYLASLLWPVNLTFIYPRWAIDISVWWQYLFPAAAIAALAAAWLYRFRGRGPLAAALLFGGTLFPVLGFLNVYPFRYAFVADHFQYLASLPILAIAAAAVSAASRPSRRVRLWAATLAGVTLAVLAWRQAHNYVDEETLYRATLKSDPDSWMAHNNLGVVLDAQDRPLEAHRHFVEAARLAPPYAISPHISLGASWLVQGRAVEGARAYARAREIDPQNPRALAGLGRAYAAMGRPDEAVAYLADASRLAPASAEIRNNLGVVLDELGRHQEAVVAYETALAIDPSNVEARTNLGAALGSLGREDDAISQFQEALRLDSRHKDAHVNLGVAMAKRGRLREAVRHFTDALAIDPSDHELRSRVAALEQAIRSGRQPEGR